MDQSQALGRVSELLERPSSPLGKPQSTLSRLGQVTSDPEMVATVAVPRVEQELGCLASACVELG